MLEDLRAPQPGRYVLDMTCTGLIGWGAVAVAASGVLGPGSWLALLVAAPALLRGLAFIHEWVHQPQMTRVRWFWHGVVGVPLLLPLLLYLPVHLGHHNPQTYGTARDGEYERMQGRRNRLIVRLLLLNFMVPLVLVVRFGLLFPLSRVSAFVRQQVLPEFVHLALRMPFRSPPLRGPVAREAVWVETACMLWAWALVGALAMGQWRAALAWALMLVGVAHLNTVRALCSTHLYVEQDDGRAAGQQLDDSLNIHSTSWLTRLIAPVGLQYYALHHLVPWLPYHAMPRAHARLLQQLPPGSPYHRATVPTLWDGWKRLRHATQASHQHAQTTPSTRLGESAL